MKITIDTKEDTHEDIKKVLHILTNILERKNHSGGINSNYTQTTTASTQADTSNLMNMFNSGSGIEDNQTTTPEKIAPEFNSFMNLVEKEEDKTKKPKIEFF